jgi:hypothetical protein
MLKLHARPGALVGLVLAAVIPLAACGDDDDDNGGGAGAAAGPAALTIVESEAGKRLNVEISGDMRPGLTEITFRNQGKRPHSAQLIGVSGSHTAAEVKKAFAATSEGGPIPDWLRAAGGVGSTDPGQTGTVTQKLGAGTYYIVDDEDEANLDRGGLNELRISGEAAGGSLPKGATVTARDYSFRASGLKAGRNTILLDNAGNEPHHLVALPINPGKDIEDVKKVVASEGGPQGPPPFDEKNGVSTSVIDGGRQIAVELDLAKKGKYALLCFISDRKGGPPHVAKGMVADATVE